MNFLKHETALVNRIIQKIYQFNLIVWYIFLFDSSIDSICKLSESDPLHRIYCLFFSQIVSIFSTLCYLTLPHYCKICGRPFSPYTNAKPNQYNIEKKSNSYFFTQSIGKSFASSSSSLARKRSRVRLRLWFLRSYYFKKLKI